ncbi:hypothetical protein SMD27_19325 [Dongia soli]|uniref:Methyltransferase domain-containing protein n=1 Tax=Dongia soli TaxID=600628 RepID=A0ABU5EHT9_9PROT|nr:methyltransferase domain-containing protein [Dongia soli]MDY0885003.1 hypothetical protein [Dongia soli]
MLAYYEQKSQPAGSATGDEGERQVTVPPLAPWENPRIRIMQLIWGAGWDKPGGAEHVLRLVKPFSLDPSKSIMEFGAGLGGGARTIAHDCAVWVTAFEGDAELTKAGKNLSVLAGLDRKAEMQLHVPNDFQPGPKHFDCILSAETLFAYPGKYELLAQFQDTLKAQGQMSITDFVLAPGASPDDERLRGIHDRPVEFWRADQYEARFRELNLDLRITEDITDQYRKLILAGLANFAQGDAVTLATARTYPEAVAAELNKWTVRLKAFDAGLLQVVRLFVIKKGGAKLMSDW